MGDRFTRDTQRRQRRFNIKLSIVMAIVFVILVLVAVSQSNGVSHDEDAPDCTVMLCP